MEDSSWAGWGGGREWVGERSPGSHGGFPLGGEGWGPGVGGGEVPRFLWRAPHSQGRELGGGGGRQGLAEVGDPASSSSRETWGV